MARIALVTSTVLLAAAVPAPPERISVASLVAADTARFQAMQDHDLPALDRAMADELVYVHSTSVRQSKADLMGDIASGKAVYDRIVVKEQQAALYGKAGVIQGIATFTVSGKPGVPPFTLRYTDVYVWRQNRWQMVAWHCTRLPDGSNAT